jgi:hypothetical protein
VRVLVHVGQSRQGLRDDAAHNLMKEEGRTGGEGSRPGHARRRSRWEGGGGQQAEAGLGGQKESESGRTKLDAISIAFTARQPLLFHPLPSLGSYVLSKQVTYKGFALAT